MESIDKIRGTFEKKIENAKPSVSTAVIKRLPSSRQHKRKMLLSAHLLC